MTTTLDSLSNRGLFEAMVEVIIEAREWSSDDSSDCQRTRRANVLRRLRLENDDVDGFRGWLEFKYDGMTFMLQDEDAYADTYQNEVDCIVEDARDNFEYAMNKADCYVSSYVKFDEEAFIRDLEYGGEVDTWIASYDGAVNDIHTTDGWFKAWRID